ncbi:hypothetical protein BS50DRAFT_587440 [Corynespora cassiicola Philippines]|uniref:Uncharacterized protein n=1 Tax=Corynespora cassiicola Philippines TaxID=1448308 RepID=A0A2T2NS76_CORCC|nr:hypothetical protein BS50DRAFT_587440 [Corynespora cassiicola Philippines]
MDNEFNFPPTTQTSTTEDAVEIPERLIVLARKARNVRFNSSDPITIINRKSRQVILAGVSRKLLEHFFGLHVVSNNLETTRSGRVCLLVRTYLYAFDGIKYIVSWMTTEARNSANHKKVFEIHAPKNDLRFACSILCGLEDLGFLLDCERISMCVSKEYFGVPISLDNLEGLGDDLPYFCERNAYLTRNIRAVIYRGDDRTLDEYEKSIRTYVVKHPGMADLLPYFLEDPDERYMAKLRSRLTKWMDNIKDPEPYDVPQGSNGFPRVLVPTDDDGKGEDYLLGGIEARELSRHQDFGRLRIKMEDNVYIMDLRPRDEPIPQPHQNMFGERWVRDRPWG